MHVIYTSGNRLQQRLATKFAQLTSLLDDYPHCRWHLAVAFGCRASVFKTAPIRANMRSLTIHLSGVTDSGTRYL